MTTAAMRTGAAAGHDGFFHETAFYGSDEALLDIVVPFLADGVAAGEPTIVTFAERNADLVRAALGDTTGVSFISGSAHYARPASTIAEYRRLFASLVAAGAPQIRVVGDVPHPGFGVGWDGWARYEAVVNYAFDDFPLWGLCPYDTRITPDEVLAEVARTHPHLATGAGEHRPNDAFEDPAALLAQRLRHQTGRPDPLEWLAPPAVDLADPTPAAARRAVGRLAGSARLDASAIDNLMVATSEVVSNALFHGRPPVTVRAWAGEGRIVVAVRDRGEGPSDPFAGLLPAQRDAGRGGLGLWLVHQLCTDVRLGVEDDGGFVVRLVAGVPEVVRR